MNIKNNSKFIVSNNLDYENISKTQLLISSIKHIKYKINEYLNIRLFILDLNKTKSKKVLIPVIEGLAYFNANIINTNDCLINLGDDIYVDTTNYKAEGIISRKIDNLKIQLNIKLQELKKINDKAYETIINNENNLNEYFSNQICNIDLNKIKNINISNNVTELEDGTYEIIEEFNDEDVSCKKDTLGKSNIKYNRNKTIKENFKKPLTIEDKEKYKEFILNFKGNNKDKVNIVVDNNSSIKSNDISDRPTKEINNNLNKLSIIDNKNVLTTSKKKKDVICINNVNKNNECNIKVNEQKESNNKRSTFFDADEDEDF